MGQQKEKNWTFGAASQKGGKKTFWRLEKLKDSKVWVSLEHTIMLGYFLFVIVKSNDKKESSIMMCTLKGIKHHDVYTQRNQASWRVHSKESSIMTCILKEIKHHDVYTCNMYWSLARRLGWGKLDALCRVSLLLFHLYWPQVSKLSYAGNLTRFHAFV